MFYGIFSCPLLLTIQNFCVPLQRKLRDGAVVARWAHNPKVVSSSLAPATKRQAESFMVQLFLFFLNLPFHKSNTFARHSHSGFFYNFVTLKSEFHVAAKRAT